jgi:hypothetical protein
MEAFVDQWENGMQTFEYTSKADPKVVVKHVFTGNTPSLQGEANNLFRDIQVSVPLAKLTKSSSTSISYILRALDRLYHRSLLPVSSWVGCRSNEPSAPMCEASEGSLKLSSGDIWRAGVSEYKSPHIPRMDNLGI